MIKILVSVLSLGLFFQTACAGNADSTPVKLLKPEPQHGTIFQTVTQAVSSYHFSKPQINDAFSAKAFDNYLNNIDPTRQYFLQSDIDAFEKYRYTIDDAVFSGDVSLAFEVFNVYRKRLYDRIDYALVLLKNDFDYTENDSFEVQREKAPWCKDFSELDLLWKRKIKFECLALRVSGKDFASYSETVRKRYENLKKFADKTKNEDVFGLYMNSLLELADPHTNYYSPRNAEDFQTSMSLSLEGIGATLQTENEYTKVREVVKGGPADRSKKIFAGDKIIAVGQGKDSDLVNVLDWRIDDVVSLIRGKKGTTVRLEIIPAKDPAKTKIIEIVRDKIVLEEQSAKSSIQTVTRNGKKVKVGVVNLPAFYVDFAAAQRGDPNYKSTTRDVAKLIAELKKEKIQGLIIDLRNNGGGSLQEAVDLTGLFIKTGPVVQVKDVTGNVKTENDFNEAVLYDGPLTVLVNRFSASASEIFAGAIQDYGRGIVMGEKTFGKGTVQNMVDLDNFIQLGGKKAGQVKLTIAKFYRVTGSSTQHKGVTPDMVFPGVFSSAKYGEEASEYALPWDQISSTGFTQTHNVDATRDKLVNKTQMRLQTNPEYKYLLEDIQYVQQEEQKKYMTLNEVRYKANTELQDKQKKQREEERKKVRKNSTQAPDLILEEAEETIADMLEY
jgi:carboxyl-terminal processing protease